MGVLLQHMKDIGIGLNIGGMTRIFNIQLYAPFPSHPLCSLYLSSGIQTGWMTWPFVIAALALRAIITYDGSSFHPDIKHFLKFVGDQGWVIFHYHGKRSWFIRNGVSLHWEPVLVFDWNPRTEYQFMSIWSPVSNLHAVSIISLPVKVSISPFDSLRTIVVTGAVLTAPVMEWTHNAFGGDKHMLSTSRERMFVLLVSPLLAWGCMECWWPS